LSCSFLVVDPARFADVFVGRVAVLLGKIDLDAFYDPIFSTPTLKDLTDDFPLLYDANYSVSLNIGCEVNFDLGTGIECDVSDTMCIIQTPLYGTAGVAAPGVAGIQTGLARMNASGISFDPNSPDKKLRLR